MKPFNPYKMADNDRRKAMKHDPPMTGRQFSAYLALFLLAFGYFL